MREKRKEEDNDDDDDDHFNCILEWIANERPAIHPMISPLYQSLPFFVVHALG